MYFTTPVFVCVFASCFPTDVFWPLSVTPGAENGSSSQGTAGQSGLMAGSTGGVSKAAKGQGSAEKEEQSGNQKRARRQWESWSAEDKNSFFEGLYEVSACIFLMMGWRYFVLFFVFLFSPWFVHLLSLICCSCLQHGKDFEAIQNNIAMKYKKRGKPAHMVKNKEQVRHFYYRTWHKISKHIDFANGELLVVSVSPLTSGNSLIICEELARVVDLFFWGYKNCIFLLKKQKLIFVIYRLMVYNDCLYMCVCV